MRGRRSQLRGVWPAAVVLATLASCAADEESPPPPVEAPSPAPPTRAMTPEALEPSPLDGQGTATVTPADSVVVSSRGTWTIEWTAGRDGLPAGGGVVLQVSPFWGWSSPQTTAPGAPGYTTASTASSATLSVATGEVPVTVVARVTDGAILPGETVAFVYGDTTNGGAGSLAEVDRYAEEFEEFLIKTDGNADGYFAAIERSPTIEIVAGPAKFLAVTAPSAIAPGRSATIGITALDAAENWAELPAGTVALRLRSLDDAKAAPIPLGGVEVASGARRAAVAATLPAAGLFRVEAELASGGRTWTGRSELVLVEAESPFADVLWGDLHIHSALSDGTGSPDDLFDYARFVAGLDVAAVTDHDAHGLFPLAERGGWEMVREAARRNDDLGAFVTLLGYEWTSWAHGHRNVYYPGLAGEVYAFRDSTSDTPERLWQRIAPAGGMTIPHHPGGGPVPVDWSAPGDEDRERVVEICSIHGSSEAWGMERGIYQPVPGAFVRDALSLGHRLGIMASGDTHDGHPGRRTRGAPANGLVAFRTGERSRRAVWSALRDRRVYGTSGPRILVHTVWGELVPGSILETPPDVPLTVRVVTPEPVEMIEVIGPRGTLARAYGGGRRVTRSFDEVRSLAPGDWFYVRVGLADGEVAWDSPYWIEAEAP